MQSKITRTISWIFFLALFLGMPAYANAANFFVNKDFDAAGRNNIDTVLEFTGNKAHFFVEKEFRNILPETEISRLNAKIKNLSSEFDNNIYPKLRDIFGSERSPGIDGDEKITILLHNMKSGVGGYVRDLDGYERSGSNEREMVYLNIDGVLNSELGPSYLSHEFQHLITFNQKTILRGVKEDKWLNEARSEYAPTVAGYNDQWSGSYLAKRVGEFLSHPSDALLDWRGRSVDHASAAMFIHYLVDRYGTGILSQMMSANSAGVDSINQAMLNLGRPERFDDVFSDWIIAVYVNSATDNEPNKYKYKNTNLSFGNLHVLPSSTSRIYGNYSSVSSFLLDNWSGQWHRFVPGSLGEDTTLHIKFSTDSSVPLTGGLSVPYVVSDFFGGTEVKFFDLNAGSVLSMPQFGTFVSSVVVMPSIVIGGQENISNSGTLSIENFVSNSFVDRFSEGALVRAIGDTKVFIIKNGSQIGRTFKRWIQTEEVFRFYNHFTWNDILEIKPELLVGFDESFLIRKTGDPKVYEVDRFGKKTWLNMTASEFEASGRSWDAVYEVNDAEFAWYK